MYYDLHVHTNASDGIYTPEQVLKQAFDIGLAGIAITDHDTVDGVQPAINYRKEMQLNIAVVAGIELNTEMYGEEIHILGYFMDYKNKTLLKHLDYVKKARRERAQKMVGRLQDMGVDICFEEVKRLVRDDLIARPHIAMVLVDKGLAASIKEAFSKYIGKGAPAYIPRYKFTPREAIELIKSAGGVSVLAHPGLLKNKQVVHEIIKQNIEGLEAYYPEHTPKETYEFVELCNRNHLLITGGSDFHGIEGEMSRNKIGLYAIPKNIFDRIYHYKCTKS